MEVLKADHLVSAKEAAKALGMGASSLYRLAKAGKVPSYVVGAQLSGVRFSISELRHALRRSYAGDERLRT